MRCLRQFPCIPGWNCTSRMRTPILQSPPSELRARSTFSCSAQDGCQSVFSPFPSFRHSYLRRLTLPLPDDTCLILDSTLDFCKQPLYPISSRAFSNFTIANCKHLIRWLWVLLMSRPRSRSSSAVSSYSSSMSLFFGSDSVSAVAKFHLYQTSLTFRILLPIHQLALPPADLDSGCHHSYGLEDLLMLISRASSRFQPLLSSNQRSGEAEQQPCLHR